MSYTPNVWQTGDVVTSAKLNNMENGIASAGGGGYDAVINVSVPNTPVLVSGDFDAVMAKVENSEPLNIGIVLDYSGGVSTCIVTNIWAFSNNNNQAVQIYWSQGINNGSAYNGYVEWDANGVTGNVET